MSKFVCCWPRVTPRWAQLRSAAEDGAAGVVPALEKIVAAIRRRCPRARILGRADSGFCRDELLAWCEAQHEVYYCVGLPKNSVLLANLQPALVDARAWRTRTRQKKISKNG